MNKHENNLREEYGQLSNILIEAKHKTSELKEVNSSFNRIKNDLLNIVEEQIKHSRDDLQEMIVHTKWDKLIIAFFGETNSGKSTIIDTFRILDRNKKIGNSGFLGRLWYGIKGVFSRGDGVIVGDGRSDFTKVYKEYNMEIGGLPFTLIDVPGIEGNEKEYKDEIKKALDKAHCVFYVQGNKKPDEAVAKKIKEYLADWVSVYSIYNVRGVASNYDEEHERTTLCIDSVRKNNMLIIDTFKKILGNIYKGNIVVQGRLAHCSIGNFRKRHDLKSESQKLVRYFGDKDKIWHFSEFSTLEKKVDDLSYSYVNIIAEANRQKLISIAEKIKSNIKMSFDNTNDQKEQLRAHLVNFRSSVKSITVNSVAQVRSSGYAVVDRVVGDFKQSVFNIIDSDMSSNAMGWQINRLQKDIKPNIERQFKDSVQSIVANAQKSIENRRKDLDGISVKRHSFKDFSVGVKSMDIDKALDMLNFNFEDAAKAGLSIAGGVVTGASLGSVIPGVGNIIGGIVGGVFSLIASFFGGEDKKSKAKREASSQIDKIKNVAYTSIDNATSDIALAFKKGEQDIVKSVNEEIYNIEQIDSINEYISNQIDSFIKTR